MFQVGERYTKKDLYKILRVPDDKRKGAWDTGYRKWENNFYIFSNVGVSGRVGQNYNNRWDGDDFIWYAKSNAKPKSKQILELQSTQTPIFLFTRTDNRLPFIYHGEVVAKTVKYPDEEPIQITWSLKSMSAVNEPGELYGNQFLEGLSKVIHVNKYERNPEARRICIEHYGAYCQVCGFSFAIYGEIGVGYIHVHHLTLISSIGKAYIIDPIKDLVPVCANCHAMIHMRTPPYTIEELSSIVKK
jgi:5-methylcytosine-specific restriction enzyme A